MKKNILFKSLFIRLLLSFVLLLSTINSIAQIGTPKNPSYGFISSTAPASYYNKLLGLSNTALRDTLQAIVVNADTKGQNYGDVWDMLEEADENPLDSTEVWLIYTETSIGKTEHVVDNVGWNREHIFPQSRGGFADGTSFTADGKDIYFSTTANDIAHAHGDAHHIRACLATENTNRGDLDFDYVNGDRTKNTYFYEPPLSAKGDVARALFYMAIRYNDLSLGVGNQDGQVIGNLTTLLEWNKLDPPDDYELRRNNVIFEWQNNRNPFIDQPELADYIWGDKVGQIWQGTSGTQIIISASSADFGTIPYGSVSTTKAYIIEAHELTDDLQILAPENFEISLTNSSESFKQQIILKQVNGNIDSTTIYMRFNPVSAFDSIASVYISHTSGKTINQLNVIGKEGNPLKTPSVLYSQDFENNCAPDWIIYSVSSNEDWFCDSYGLNGSQGIKINNYQADDDSEDWFISPQFTITGYSNPELKFWLESSFLGSTLELLYSTDYSGSNNPNLASWTKVSNINLTDNWTQQIIDLSSISSDAFYLAFKHTSVLPEASRINIDNIELYATPIVPEIITDSLKLNFSYTSPGDTSSSMTYTVFGSNLEGDIIIKTDLPFELSLDDNTWSDSLTISQSDASSKLIYVRFKPVTEYLKGYTVKIIHSTTNGTIHIVDLLAADRPTTIVDAKTLTKSETLDMVTWNLEWFGAPEKSNSATTWEEQLSIVSTTILNLDADIYALQEVVVDNVNGNYLDSLVNKLNNIAGNGTYSAVLGPRYSLDDQAPSTEWPAQRVCYIYRTEYFSNIVTESMFSDLYPNSNVSYIDGYTGDPSLFWASGRLPFLFKSDVSINGLTIPVDFINIHAKCCSDSKERREADALFLKNELDKNFDTNNLIILGDYNDYCEGSISGGSSPYYTWFENANKDYLCAANASIDHISISNELYYENMTLINNDTVIVTSISDHNPVMLRLKLYDNNLRGQIIKFNEVQNVEYASDPFFIYAESSENLPVKYEVLSGPATLSGSILTVTDLGSVIIKAFNEGDINILPASDTIQFEVIKASQTIFFDLPDEVPLSTNSIALKAYSSSGLDVSYRIIAGKGSISGNILSFTEAGDISIEAYQEGNDKYNSATSVTKIIKVIDDISSSIKIIKDEKLFSVYPNPTNGLIRIKSDFSIEKSIFRIFTLKGKLVAEYRLNKNDLFDISFLKSGMYFIILKTDKETYSTTLILKK